MRISKILTTIFTCAPALISAIEIVSGTEYKIKAKLSDKYITAATSGNVHQWEELNNNSQLWRFISVGDGKYAILSGTDTNLAMTVENGNANNGNNIYLSPYKKTTAQHFILHKTGDAYYITAECSDTAAIDVYDISTENGANIDQWKYWNGEGQKFYIVETEEEITEEPKKAYLFAYFQGNSPSQEQMSYAVSTDGYNFKSLNGGKSVWKSSVGTNCIRDPYIFLGEDGYYYLLATDMKSSLGWDSNRDLVSAKSKDLIHWTDETSIKISNAFSNMKGADRAWAPQAIYDPEVRAYMIYFAVRVPDRDKRTIMYYAYSKDMKKLEGEPKLLFAPKDNMDAIDSDIIYQNGKYYMYYKNESKKRICLATADHASGPYQDIKQVTEGNIGVEGPNIYKLIDSNKWLIMSDAYYDHYFYMQETTDLVNFKTVNRNSYSFDFTPRHGYVIQITAGQYNGLVKAFPSNGITTISNPVKPKTKKLTTTTTTTTTTIKATTTSSKSSPTNSYACISERNKLGYPCCKYCTIIDSDLNGDYGVENDQWCSIPYSCYKQQEGKHENGYPYCKSTKMVVYTDDVEWGVENGEWCVIDKSKQTQSCDCWAEPLGFPCCKDKTEYYSDENGRWGYENDDWCGIIEC